MSRLFYTSKGKPCGILSSEFFNKKSFKQRERFAFNKNSYKDLDAVDRAQLSGYAHAINERKRAQNYKFKKAHPNYKRKTTTRAKKK